MANQLSARELQELKKLYQDIDGLTQSQADFMAQQVQQIGNARRELDRLKTEYNKLTSDISDSLTIFQRITQEISNQNTGINESKKGYRGLTSIAEKIQYYQQEITNLSSKEVKKLIEKKNQEVLRLANTRALLEADKDSLENKKQQNLIEQNRLENVIRNARLNHQSAIDEVHQLRRLRGEHTKIENKLDDINIAYVNNEAIIENQDEAIKNLNRTLEKTLEDTLAVEHAMGVTGALMKGMSKIPFLGDLSGMSDVLSEVESKIKSTQEATGQTVSRTEALKMTFSKLGPVIKGAISDPLTIGLFLLKEFWDTIKAADKATGDLAKQIDLSYDNASSARQEFARIANLSGDAAVNVRGLQESYSAIATSLGVQADINEKDLEIFTKLREQAGFTNEELVSIQKLSLVTGKNIEDTTKEFLGGAEALSAQKGLAINVKQLLKETSNISNAIKLSIGGGAKGLAEAAVKAKEFGINLEQADKIASSLLEFESSISSELEAELLTGKQLNLETARLAALNGDIGKVAEEINSQIGGSAEFTKMNRIQQEAYARAVGMSREELANSLVEQEGLQKIGVKTAAQAKEKYDNLRKTMSAEEASAALGDDALARQYEQQSIQEKFNQSVEKLKDIFVSIADPVLQIVKPLADLVSTILPAINFLLSPLIEGFSLIGQLVSGFVNGLKEGQPVMVGLAAALTALLAPTIMTAIFGIFSTFAKIPFGLGIPLAITAIAGMISLATKSTNQVKSIKDGVINPKGGLVVSGEKGSIQLDPNDSIVAGTNLRGNNNQPPQQSMVIDYDKLAAAMSKIQINNTLTVDKQVLANTVNSTNNTTSVQIQ
jgi:hypothetical protein